MLTEEQPNQLSNGLNACKMPPPTARFTHAVGATLRCGWCGNRTYMAHAWYAGKHEWFAMCEPCSLTWIDWPQPDTPFVVARVGFTDAGAG